MSLVLPQTGTPSLMWLMYVTFFSASFFKNVTCENDKAECLCVCAHTCIPTYMDRQEGINDRGGQRPTVRNWLVDRSRRQLLLPFPLPMSLGRPAQSRPEFTQTPHSSLWSLPWPQRPWLRWKETRIQTRQMSTGTRGAHAQSPLMLPFMGSSPTADPEEEPPRPHPHH